MPEGIVERFRAEPKKKWLDFFSRTRRGFTEARSIEIARKLFTSGVTIGSFSVIEGAFRNQLVGDGGSGFVATKEGWIITNHHVVSRALSDSLRVQFAHEEQPRRARVIGEDQTHDLALLKVEGRVSVPPLNLGDSRSVVAGQSVRVFGSAFLKGSALRQGIVSGYREFVDSKTGKVVDGRIQTDAAMNPGDSGGPTVDEYGEVIGINQMIISSSGGSNGVNFAVPSEYAKMLIRKTRKELRKRK